jgi:hypothetical protein
MLPLLQRHLRIKGKLSSSFLPLAFLRWHEVVRRFAETEAEELAKAVLIAYQVNKAFVRFYSKSLLQSQPIWVILLPQFPPLSN